jgi:hypothetical protein
MSLLAGHFPRTPLRSRIRVEGLVATRECGSGQKGAEPEGCHSRMQERSRGPISSGNRLRWTPVEESLEVEDDAERVSNDPSIAPGA